MSDIVLSGGVRNNLLSLQMTASLQEKTQYRLATGRKVNSALDNPINYFAAANLNSRAQDISKLLDLVANATKTLDAADKGISAITKLIESAQATANQARQDSTPAAVATITSLSIAGATNRSEAASKLLAGTEGTTGMGLAATDVIRITSVNSSTGNTTQIDISVTATKTVQNMVDEINSSGAAIASITADGKIKLESTSNNADLTVQASATGAFTNDVERVGKVLGSGIDASIGASSGTLTPASFTLGDIGGGDATSATTLASLGILNGSTLTLRVTDTSNNVTTQTLAVTGATTIANLVSAFNGAGGITVTDNTGTPSDTVSFAGVSTTAKIELSVSGTGLTDATIATNFGGLRTDASLSDSSDGGGAGASATRRSLASQFNELRNQIDKLSTDAGYNGINVLRGDNLRVIFNELTGNKQSYLDVVGVNVDSASLGIKDAVSATSGYNSFASNADVDRAMTDLSNALKDMRSQASTFGSNLSVVQIRQDFMKSIVTTLKTGADGLVLADTNEEGANLLALNTRQQLSSTALSLAAQSEQQVLRLFG